MLRFTWQDGPATGELIIAHEAQHIEAFEFADGTTLSSITYDTASGQYLASGTDAVDVIRGGLGNDTLVGAAGNDVLNGLAGDDVLRGDDGDDHLTGGDGNDTLLGGAGSDIFVFTQGDGADSISDFAAGQDAVDFTDHALFNSFADVQAVMSQSGSDTLIDAGPEDRITFVGVLVGDLSAGDFLFV